MCNYEELPMELLILKSLGIHLPIIKEIGYEPMKPIMLVVEKGKSRTIAKLLIDEGVPILNELQKLKQMGAILTKYNSTFIPYFYLESNKSKEFMKILCSVVRAGEIEGEKLNVMPLIISERVPYDCDMSNFFTIYIEDKIVNEGTIDDAYVVPADEQIPVVLDLIRRLCKYEYKQEQKALIASICFLYPSPAICKNEHKLDEFVKCSEYLVERDEDNYDTNNLNEVFLHEVYDWQERMKFGDVYELPNLDMATIEKIDVIILYDTEFIYLKESFFKVIVSRLLEIFSIDVLKKTLVETGILCADKMKTYTTKVGYYNLAGQYQRIRMLKFKRSQMNLLGEMDIIELCIDAKEMDKC